jgi:predicted amidohydrolase
VLSQSRAERLYMLGDLVRTQINDHSPARPDILVLPELMLPGPFHTRAQGYDPSTDAIAPGEIASYFHERAISIPGPETRALVELADELQLSMVVGVAERAQDTYYNTVLLIDPEGIYGTYRKLHLTQRDRLWATPGDMGLPVFDTPTGRIGLATGYDALFPETLRILAGKGADLVCVPALLNFPDPIGLAPTAIPHLISVAPEDFDPLHYLLWRIRAAEHNVYLALANWSGQHSVTRANGMSGIFSPFATTYPWSEVIADEGDDVLTMMTIDTREQRTGRRTTHSLNYSPGDMAGSLTGELAYNVLDSIPGNVARSKPMLRKRLPFWYLDLARSDLQR